MICMRRNKRKFYLCKKNPNDTKFQEPILLKLNYEPIDSDGERLTLGEDYFKFLKIKCTTKELSLFENGDKCYIYVNPPEVHDVLCKKADYIVDNGPQETLNHGEIRLRKLSGK